MSLSISVWKNDIALASINWFRNPLGLITVVERNLQARFVDDVLSDRGINSLRDICGRWSYDEAKNIDRKLFKKVVDRYGELFLQIDDSEIFLEFRDDNEFKQFMVGSFVPICPVRYKLTGRLIEHLNLRQSHDGEIYKTWMRELMRVADVLQDETTEFYCTN